MADERIVAQDTFEQSIKDILTVLVNSTYQWEEYTDSEISDILEITDEQAMQLTKILNDQVVANNKLWSSSKTDAEIKNALIESNKYSDELIGKISSISLEYVTTLPTSDIKSNVIYILQGTPNTLNVFNESTSSFVSVGDLNLDLSGYYTSTEVDNLLADKADDNTVVHANDIVQDLTTTSGTTVLSSAGLQTELDKKANDDEVVKTTDIATSISNTPSDEKVVSEKAVDTAIKNIASPNQNLLDNPWFTVNQRGFTSIDTSKKRGVYSVDRWIAGNNNAYTETIAINNDNSITFTFTSDVTSGPTEWVLRQRIELDRLVEGKTYTLSIDVKEVNCSSFGVVIQGRNPKYVSTLLNTVNITSEGILSASFTVPTKTTETHYHIAIIGNNNVSTNDSITIRSVKLELGSVSTLHLDSAPNYATELVKCQRYYVNYTDLLLPIVANQSGSNLLFAPLTFPNNINKISGIIDTANYNINYINLNGTKIDKTTISSLGIYGVNNNTGYIQIALASNITDVPSSGLIHLGKLELSADL